MATFTLNVDATIVRVAVSAKRGQDFVEFNLNDFPTPVLERGLVEGFRKAISDIGGGKDVTDAQRKALMEKRIATWKGGDWAGTGGGTGDPVAVQIRELIIADVKSKRGLSHDGAIKALKADGIKGSGYEMVAAIAAGQSAAMKHDSEAAKAHHAAKLEAYESRAKAVLAALHDAAKVEAPASLLNDL